MILSVSLSVDVYFSRPSCICSVLRFDPVFYYDFFFGRGFVSPALYLRHALCSVFVLLFKTICKSTNRSCKVRIVLRVLCCLFYCPDRSDRILLPLSP